MNYYELIAPVSKKHIRCAKMVLNAPREEFLSRINDTYRVFSLFCSDRDDDYTVQICDGRHGFPLFSFAPDRVSHCPLPSTLSDSLQHWGDMLRNYFYNSLMVISKYFRAMRI